MAIVPLQLKAAAQPAICIIDPNPGKIRSKDACTNLVFAAAILVLRRDEILPLLRGLVTDARFMRIVGEPSA
jgi:hypothetical protein